MAVLQAVMYTGYQPGLEDFMKTRHEYNKKQFGRNLRKCRIEKNYTVEQVRDYLQLGSKQAVYKWEEGTCYPQTDTLFALLELYEAELSELLRWNDIQGMSVCIGEEVCFCVKLGKRRLRFIKNKNSMILNFGRQQAYLDMAERNKWNIIESYFRNIQKQAA